MKRRRSLLAVVVALVATLVPIVASQLGAGASVFPDSTEVTYKEYWVPHSQFTAGCGATAPNIWYTEPGPCAKTLTFSIPDNFANALKTELYVDLWRAGRPEAPAARFQVNGGIVRTATVGNEFSRSPYVVELPKSTFRQGSNTISFTASPSDARYHIHDVVVRIYHDASHPLVAGAGSDVTPPTASLVDVSGIAASSGGTVNVDSDTLNLRATATGAAYVDFLGYYDGYDEDIDGFTLDWHGQYHNNWGPGGTTPKASGATIDHVGTDTTPDGSGFYSVAWNLPDVPNQSNVRFKIRAADANGNVREAPGGISGGFTLTRSVTTEVYRIPGFTDTALHHGGDLTDEIDRTIELPDLANVQSAYLIGQFWQNPYISLNGNARFKAFNSTCETCGEDIWSLSKRSVPVTQLVPGENTITYEHNPNQSTFGSFVEKPGPMIVLRRSAGSGAPVITRQPSATTVPEGTPVTFSVNARGAMPLSYQWQRNGVAIPGATAPSYRLPAVTPADSGALYRVVVTNGSGSVTSSTAALTVVGAGPWWDQQWDYRLPVLVNAAGYARTDAIVEATVDFTAAFAAAGSPQTLDPDSIRVVEVDGNGTVIDADITSQLDPSATFDAATAARGTLVFRAEGAWSATANRIFHVYFDTPAAGIAPVTAAPLVSVTDDVDEGQATFKVTTPTATWQYQKQGGSFSSVLDVNGNDWMGYNPSSSPTGASGSFRGLPNFPYPEGHFHPGFTSSTSQIVSQGPLRIVLESTSNDGIWSYRTAIYPTHATSTVTKVDEAHKYWFLYEGTPGGALGSEDVVVRSTGQQTAFNTSWSGDIVGDEWAYVGDTVKNRSFFLSTNKDDGFVDSYFQLDNAMTVLGFGRTNVGGTARMLVDEAGGEYSYGLVDTTAFATARPIITGRYKDLAITTGRAQRDLGPALTASIEGVTVTPTPTGATVSWTSATPTSGEVEHFAPFEDPTVVADSSFSASHIVTISGLPCETTRSFLIRATDGGGRTTETPTATFTTSSCSPVPVFTGDDFAVDPLNDDVWTAVDPVGDGTVSTSGDQLVLSVPAGADHDAWTGTNRGLRVVQPVDGMGDGTWQIKVDSIPNVNDTFTGLLFEESPSKWVRFDFLYVQSKLRVFGGTINGTTGTAKHSTIIPTQTGPLWLRVTRTGSTWQAFWSNNGSTFTALPSFSFPMTVATAGVFAGAHGTSPAATPAFTSRIDYVQDNAAPLTDDVTPSGAPEVAGIGFTARPDSVTLRWTTDRPARSMVSYGDPEDPTIIDGPTVTRHVITVPDLACGQDLAVAASVFDRYGNENSAFPVDAFTTACGTVLQSDEFGGAELGSQWKVFSPQGDVGPPLMTGTNAIIDLPAGEGHDLVAPFDAHRLLQYAPNSDLHIEAKWETLPYAQFQSEGVIVQAGVQDLVRFETYHNGSQLRLYAATVVGGSLTQRLDQAISATGGITLRVKRVGDTWTLSYQLPGGSLVQAATFTHAMAVANAGVFVVNSNTNPANVPQFAASLDWFRNLDQAAPADDTDTTPAVMSNLVVEPSPAHAYVRWETDEPATSRVDYGATTAYGTNKSSASRVLHHEVILTPLSCGRTYHLKATSVDAAGLPVDGGDITFDTPACPAIQSDGFNGSTLNGQWRYVDPKGDVTGPVMTGTSVGFNLPGGSRHDMWQAALEAPRLLQAAPNTDFQLATRWATAPTQNTQSEGMLVMQDPTNFVRFDIYSDGSTTKAFAATFLNAAPTVRANITIPTLSAYHQRITRTGNSFNLQWSGDGTTWSNVATFSYTLGVNDVGVFATNTNAGGSPPAWQPRLDRFDNTADPSTPDDTTAPVITDVAVVPSGANAAVTWTTDEPATSKVDFGQTSSYGAVSQNAALVTNHTIEIGPITCGRTYHHRITSTDAYTNTSSTSDATFTFPCAGGVESDSFSESTLDPRWTFVNPVGDVPAPVMTGTDVRFDIPAGVSHDQWTNNLKSPQLIQSVPNGDFEIEAKWNSALTKPYQFQGLIVRADADDFIRFDAVRTGTTTQNAFVASFVNGVATQRASVATTITAPMFQRVGRVGSTWTYKISPNGTTWTTIATFSHALNVTAVGVFAGNHHPTPSKIPAFSPSLDWFHNTANPLPDDTSVITGQIENDDFSAGLNTGRWTFVNPRNGDATLQVTGGEAVITLPGGSNHDHDAFHEFLTVPRIEQQIEDIDFETEVRFGSAPSLATPNQMQGVLVRESDDRWARFDITTVNDHFEVYAATWDGTAFVERVRRFIRGGDGFMIRLRRVGDTWTYSYAYDDLHWTHAITFGFPMDVATVGPFFGNVPIPGQPFSTTPPFTGRVDYMVNRALPPASEDGAPYPPAAIPPVIDVWYGDNQTFGAIGKPQQWVNVLGDVADFDGMTSLSYRLNGGAPQPLSMGETDNRLAAPGDFNVELDYAQLNPGANSLELTATDAMGNVTTRTVTLTNAYTGQAWPQTYSIDWASAGSITDVAQIADGQWQIEGSTIRTVGTGYDRAIAVGDPTWDRYEAVVDVTIHSMHPRDNGVGLVAGWLGATTDNYGTPNPQQPRIGHPFPGLGWYSKEIGRLQRLNIYRNLAPQHETRLAEHPTYLLTPGVTYTFKLRVEPIDAATSQYSLKVWEAGTTEPVPFQVTAASARRGGSLLLAAHRSDVSFGGLTVTQLP